MFEQYRTRLAGTTIDEATLLSTDYFNTFNEVVMLLGMLPEMPEMIGDIDAWQFRTYEQHFAESHRPFAAASRKRSPRCMTPSTRRAALSVRSPRKPTLIVSSSACLPTRRDSKASSIRDLRLSTARIRFPIRARSTRCSDERPA